MDRMLLLWKQQKRRQKIATTTQHNTHRTIHSVLLLSIVDRELSDDLFCFPTSHTILPSDRLGETIC